MGRSGHVVAMYEPQTFNQARLATNAVVPGRIAVQGFTVYNSSAAAGWVHWFDESGVPAAGTAPAMPVPIAAHDVVGVFFGDKGRNFERGCTVVFSSTETTLTVGGAVCFFDVNYCTLDED